MEQAVFTNMCMVYDGDKVLVQDRKNPNWPGYVFPGGHVEPKESFVASTIREVEEETGLKVWDLQLCGTKQFIMEDGQTRYVVLLYKTNQFTGQLKSSDEGQVFWLEKSQLDPNKFATGFDSLLEIFLDASKTENYWSNVNGEWQNENL